MRIVAAARRDAQRDVPIELLQNFEVRGVGIRRRRALVLEQTLRLFVGDDEPSEGIRRTVGTPALVPGAHPQPQIETAQLVLQVVPRVGVGRYLHCRLTVRLTFGVGGGHDRGRFVRFNHATLRYRTSNSRRSSALVGLAACSGCCWFWNSRVDRVTTTA